MEFLIVFIVLAFAVQAFLFFYGRNKKKDIVKSVAILEKYGIKTKGDIFKLINSHAIPEEDRLKLEDYYQKGF